MIRDQETINALVDIIERFVRERLIPAEDQMAEEGKLPDD
ncbi:MAG: acyl-CoA dehydrogenase, partial [OM182 bacterium]